MRQTWPSYMKTLKQESARWHLPHISKLPCTHAVSSWSVQIFSHTRKARTLHTELVNTLFRRLTDSKALVGITPSSYLATQQFVRQKPSNPPIILFFPFSFLHAAPQILSQSQILILQPFSSKQKKPFNSNTQRRSMCSFYNPAGIS